MKDPENLTWYIVPNNILNFDIVGADPNDTQKTLEDGGEFYIHSAKVHAVLLRFIKSSNKLSGLRFFNEGVYMEYLEPDKFHGYTWEEIKKIAIDVIFDCKESGYKIEKHYKVKD